MRPVITSPAAKPHARRISARMSRRVLMVQVIVDAARRSGRGLGTRHRQHAVAQVGDDALWHRPATGRLNVRLNEPCPRSMRWYCSQVTPCSRRVPESVRRPSCSWIWMSSRRRPGNFRGEDVAIGRFVEDRHGGTHPSGPGANRSSRCWMARRSRIGSQRANATRSMLAQGSR